MLQKKKFKTKLTIYDSGLSQFDYLVCDWNNKNPCKL